MAMVSEEELFNEQQFLQLNQMQQSELITKHCSGVEERIRHAISREEAERIAGVACNKFKDECTSSIVRIALTQYIQMKISQYWDKQ
jgi:hypothetical protein